MTSFSINGTNNNNAIHNIPPSPNNDELEEITTSMHTLIGQIHSAKVQNTAGDFIHPPLTYKEHCHQKDPQNDDNRGGRNRNKNETGKTVENQPNNKKMPKNMAFLNLQIPANALIHKTTSHLLLLTKVKRPNYAWATPL